MRAGIEKFANIIKESRKNLDLIPKDLKENSGPQENSKEELNDLETEEGASNSIKELLELIEKESNEANLRAEKLKSSSLDFNTNSTINLNLNLVKDLASLSEKIKKTLNIKSAQSFVYDAYIGYENILLAFHNKLQGFAPSSCLNKQRWILIRKIYCCIITSRINQWQIRKRIYTEAQVPSTPPEPVKPNFVSSPSQKSDVVDDEVIKVLQELGVLELPVKKIAEGQYMVANKKLNMKILNGFLVVRIGGGYMKFKEFIEKHAKSLGVIVNPNPVGRVGTAVLSSGWKMNLIEKK